MIGHYRGMMLRTSQNCQAFLSKIGAIDAGSRSILDIQHDINHNLLNPCSLRAHGCEAVQQCIIGEGNFYTKLNAMILKVKSAAESKTFENLPKLKSMPSLTDIMSEIVESDQIDVDEIRNSIVDAWTPIIDQWISDNFEPLIGTFARECHAKGLCIHPDQTSVFQLASRLSFLLDNFVILHLNGDGEALKSIIAQLWKRMEHTVNNRLHGKSFHDFLADSLLEHPWNAKLV